MDDLKSSHIDPKVNDEFDTWLQNNYGTHGKVMIHRGKVYQYLSMELDYAHRGTVKISMIKHAQGMLEDFPIQFKKAESVITPASDGLFNLGEGGKLHQEHAEEFHMMVAKALFLCKWETRYTAYSSCIMHEGI